jgi:hypothetical protein
MPSHRPINRYRCFVLTILSIVVYLILFITFVSLYSSYPKETYSFLVNIPEHTPPPSSEIRPEPAPAPILMYGASIRPLSEILLSNAIWYNAPVLDGPLKHSRSVHMAMQAQIKSFFCDSNRKAWVWVEDDVDTCEPSISHLNHVISWIGNLPAESPLVYVRTSFGFNGLVVRCERHEEFVEAIDKSQSDIAVDDQLSRLLHGKTAAYRWNLFDHHASSSTIQENHSGRDRQVPICMQILLYALVDNLEYYHSRCLLSDSFISPCSSNEGDVGLDGTGYYTKSSDFPITDTHALHEFSPQLSNEKIVVGRGSGTCAEVCRNDGQGQICSESGLANMNHRMYMHGNYPRSGRPPINGPDDRPSICARLTFSSADGPDQPMVFEDRCYARVAHRPVCDGKGEKRICVCISE